MSTFYYELLKELNSLRKNPSLYADKILSYKKYFKGNNLKLPGVEGITQTEEGPGAYDEAAKFLKSIKPLEEVIPSKGLGRIAKDYLDKIKHLDPDRIDEIDIDIIIKKYGSFIGSLNTATDFGNNNAEFVIVSLIVSDGDYTRNNRDLLLNPELKKVGFSKAKHITYDYLTIITLCSDFRNTFDKDDNEDFGGLLKPKQENNSYFSTSSAYITTTSKENVKSSEETRISREDEVLINEIDVVSYERKERLVIERGKTKKKIILMKKFKDVHKKKEVRYIPL